MCDRGSGFSVGGGHAAVRGVTTLILVFWLGCAVAAESDDHAAAPPGGERDGKQIYEYYCYQCHGYGGDGETLAGTYLDPPPRDFTATSPDSLSLEGMRNAVRAGRPGSAMVGFARVLSDVEIDRVVAYIRRHFMVPTPYPGRYHSAANGWPRHERMTAAFPFVSGEMSLDTPVERLSERERQGRALFLGACVSCHDRPGGAVDAMRWRPRAVSYPRRHYSHREPDFDAMTGATTFGLHDLKPQRPPAGAAEARGEASYVDNCAFCHALDGTGRNWIGSFLEPSPADLSSDRVRALTIADMRDVILDGLPGTTMPAWRHVLSSREIDEIIAYVDRTFRQRVWPTSDEDGEGRDQQRASRPHHKPVESGSPGADVRVPADGGMRQSLRWSRVSPR